MKTATITFHAPNNNGSFLQAYALQRTLAKTLNIDNQIIDFCSERQSRQYSVLRLPRSAGDVGRDLISLMHYSKLKRRFKRFDTVRKTYLNMTERCSQESGVYAIAERFDAVICGSDQIWNTGARDYSDAYFMPEYSGRKISYAASFGSRLEDIDRKKALGFIRSFDAVSVREEAGLRFLTEQGVADVQKVCDPVLLLDRDDYIPLMNKAAVPKRPYIFLYTISYSDEVLKTARSLSEKYGLEVYAPFTGYSAVKAKKYGIKIIYDAGPREFLALLDGAEYVCSNSFHGTVFSVIFEKEFFRPSKWDAENGGIVRDDRVDGFLDALGLGGRVVYEKNGATVFPDGKADFSAARQGIDELRAGAVGYLKKSLTL